jgi:hypothetical protein
VYVPCAQLLFLDRIEFFYNHSDKNGEGLLSHCYQAMFPSIPADVEFAAASCQSYNPPVARSFLACESKLRHSLRFTAQHECGLMLSFQSVVVCGFTASVHWKLHSRFRWGY